MGNSRRWLAAGVVGGLTMVACGADHPSRSQASADSAVTAGTVATPPEASEPGEGTEPDASTAVHGSPAPAGDPYAQTVNWSQCGDLECATVIVPIDYADPSQGTTAIALAKRAATGRKRGTLFVNPGGPGGSGIHYLHEYVDASELNATYDIVGFDPRGVGQSDPLGCLDTAGEDALIAANVDPRHPEDLQQSIVLLRQAGEACLRTNPRLARHVTSVETAKDLDVLRAVVGDDSLNYFGASYGTYLGATYAALFPERVGRLVLDGAYDPSLPLRRKASMWPRGSRRHSRPSPMTVSPRHPAPWGRRGTRS